MAKTSRGWGEFIRSVTPVMAVQGVAPGDRLYTRGERCAVTERCGAETVLLLFSASD